MWRVADGASLHTLRGHTADVLSVAYHPKEDWLASSGQDGVVRIWEAGTDPEARTLSLKGAPVTGVAFSRDGHWLAAGSHDRTVRLWDRHAGASEPRVLGPHGERVWSVAFSPDDASLAVGSGEWEKPESRGEVRVWDVGTGREALASGHRRFSRLERGILSRRSLAGDGWRR